MDPIVIFMDIVIIKYFFRFVILNQKNHKIENEILFLNF